MNQLFQHIPEEFWQFIVITLFSLLIGLEQRRLHQGKDDKIFGSDRTFTFIGIFGYMLFVLDKISLIPYLGGGLVLAILLAVHYFHKIYLKQDFGLTSILVALITYTLPAFALTQAHWLSILLVVTVLVLTESKVYLGTLLAKFDDAEFFTLAKFLVLAGVILPIVPQNPINDWIEVSPYKLWLAVVVVSGISYLSYLLQKFIFPSANTLLFGFLGGVYSSTATTLLLSRKSQNELKGDTQLAAAILLATATMYGRILGIAFIFNVHLAIILLPYMLIMVLCTLLTAWWLLDFRNPFHTHTTRNLEPNNHPLELKIAFLFALLYIFISIITKWSLAHLGNLGLDLLSLIVGLSNIDAFLLNIFQGKFMIAEPILAIAIMQAIISNNIFKMGICWFIADKSTAQQGLKGFLVIIFINLVLLFILRFII